MTSFTIVTRALSLVSPSAHRTELRRSNILSLPPISLLLQATKTRQIIKSHSDHLHPSSFLSTCSIRHASSSSDRHNNTNDATEETAPFDRSIKLKQRQRAAESARLYSYHAATKNPYSELHSNVPSHQQQPIEGSCSMMELPYDYFHKEVAFRLVDRLNDISIREESGGGFPLALEIGSAGGGDYVYRAIVEGLDDNEFLLDHSEQQMIMERTGGRGGVRKLVQIDSCSDMLYRNQRILEISRDNCRDNNKSERDQEDGTNVAICDTCKLVVEDEKYPFQFPEETFDLVISSMTFHWINDLPRLLLEIKRILKPNGCLLFALPGGNTLPELRSSLVLSEIERTGGVSTHVGPFIDVSNVGGLLTGTGFRLPTVDVDEIQIGYPNMMVLMEHLGRMGEGNACSTKKERVGIETFLSAACLYRELYPSNNIEASYIDDDREEGIVASVQVIYGIAWKEHESQQKPLERGSASRKMTDIAMTKTNGKVNV